MQLLWLFEFVYEKQLQHGRTWKITTYVHSKPVYTMYVTVPLQKSVKFLPSCCFVFIAEPLFRSPCELLPVGLGHPVQAMQKSFTALSGCASKATIGLPQEVHIVNLRGHKAEGARNTLPEVSKLKLSHAFYGHI